jgi:hypothetical protein
MVAFSYHLGDQIISVSVRRTWVGGDAVGGQEPENMATQTAIAMFADLDLKGGEWNRSEFGIYLRQGFLGCTSYVCVGAGATVCILESHLGGLGCGVHSSFDVGNGLGLRSKDDGVAGALER